MTCDEVGKLIPLYFYGELPPEEEESLEAHLHECAACAGDLERQRRLAAALDRSQAEPPPSCSKSAAPISWPPSPAPIRNRMPPTAPRAARRGAWDLFLDALTDSLGLQRWRVPVGAVALVALGFFSARFTGLGPIAAQVADLSGSPQVFSTVRSIQPDSAGRVRIAYDETRRRELDGRMDDPGIRRMLLAASSENNPAVRVVSVELLGEGAGSSEVRDALLNALLHDSNVGVRMKALEGLKPLAGDPQVRKSLAGALMTDDNPAVRMQVVDLLVSRRDDAVVGVLQDLVQKENNDYVRLKCEQALKEWNASIGTF